MSGLTLPTRQVFRSLCSISGKALNDIKLWMLHWVLHRSCVCLLFFKCNKYLPLSNEILILLQSNFSHTSLAMFAYFIDFKIVAGWHGFKEKKNLWKCFRKSCTENINFIFLRCVIYYSNYVISKLLYSVFPLCKCFFYFIFFPIS